MIIDKMFKWLDTCKLHNYMIHRFYVSHHKIKPTFSETSFQKVLSDRKVTKGSLEKYLIGPNFISLYIQWGNPN